MSAIYRVDAPVDRVALETEHVVNGTSVERGSMAEAIWLTMLLSAGARIVEEERLTMEARAIRAHVEAIALSRLRDATVDCGLREEHVSVSWLPPDHRGLQICRAEASFSRPMAVRELPEGLRNYL